MTANAPLDELIAHTYPYRGLAWPNPTVGASVVKDGRILGVGVHTVYGEAHAERIALAAAGDNARGATLYSTLEPCTHTGKTPPCCEAIIDAGIHTVVWASDDPHAHVRIRPAQPILEGAGIRVQRGSLDAKARHLNPALFHTKKRPYITLKIAQSLDGKLVAPKNRYITNTRARRFVHQLRHEVDAVLIGGGTLRHDDPELTIRHDIPHTKLPDVIILSRHAPDKHYACMQAKRQVHWLDYRDGWDAIMDQIAALGYRHILVEGGPVLLNNMIDKADTLILMTAGCILGGEAHWGISLDVALDPIVTHTFTGDPETCMRVFQVSNRV